MEPIYDMNHQIVGYEKDCEVYDCYGNHIGYWDDHELYDHNGNLVGYIEDDVIYTAEGECRGYLTEHMILDHQYTPVARVHSPWGAFAGAATLLLLSPFLFGGFGGWGPGFWW